MNAYELAKNISKDNCVILADDKKVIANMLRHQADRIVELEKDLHMVQRHNDQLDHDLPNAEPVARVIRNGAGQITMQKADGSYFNIADYVGQIFYTTPHHGCETNKGERMNQWIELENQAGKKCLVDMKHGWIVTDCGDEPAHWGNDHLAMNRMFNNTYAEIKNNLFGK